MNVYEAGDPCLRCGSPMEPMACAACVECTACAPRASLACGLPPGSLCHTDDWRENAEEILSGNGEDVDAVRAETIDNR